MQIPPSSSAANAAGIASQSASKEAAGQSASGDSANIAQISIEQSGESNQDRDAQGQGDGLADRSKAKKNPPENGESAPLDSQHKPAPRLPGQPPPRLDVMG